MSRYLKLYVYINILGVMLVLCLVKVVGFLIQELLLNVGKIKREKRILNLYDSMYPYLLFQLPTFDFVRKGPLNSTSPIRLIIHCYRCFVYENIIKSTRKIYVFTFYQL